MVSRAVGDQNEIGGKEYEQRTSNGSKLQPGLT
jgi:hypothetical protein